MDARRQRRNQNVPVHRHVHRRRQHLDRRRHPRHHARSDPADLSAIDSKYENGEDFALIDELCRISGVKIPAAVEEIRSAAVLHNTVVDRDEMKQTVLEFLGL